MATLATGTARAQSTGFERWVITFRPKAIARGVSEATYIRVMSGVKPDTAVYALVARQDEFAEAALAVSQSPRLRLAHHDRHASAPSNTRALLARIEQDYGVDRYIHRWRCGASNRATATSSIIRKYMRPVIPALAALAWGEPRRRAYWEQELINALDIVDRGWGSAEEMIGSWAGAMGHTQWMPEVWLNVGVDYDQTDASIRSATGRRASPAPPAIWSSAANYRRGEAWGCEVQASPASAARRQQHLAHLRGVAGARRRARRRQAVRRVRGPRPPDVPVPGGPAFLIGQNFSAVKSYNPAFSYALAIVPSRRPHPRRRTVRAAVSRRRTRANDRGSPGDAAPPDRRRLRHRRQPTAASAATPCRRCATISARSGSNPPTAMPALKVLARLRQGLRRSAGIRFHLREKNALTRRISPPGSPDDPHERDGADSAQVADCQRHRRARTAYPAGVNAPMFGSDVAADALRALDIPYIALNPGASYRGLHDSLVNYLGNSTPQMLLCLHEEAAVAIAHGYAKVTGKAMAAAVHSNVGLMHATMAFFNAWCDRMPVVVLGATGPVDAAKRRPWIDWIHTARDQGALVRNYTKWDDQPASPAAIREAAAARRLDRQHHAEGPGLHQPRRRAAGGEARRAAAADRHRAPHAAGRNRRAARARAAAPSSF